MAGEDEDKIQATLMKDSSSNPGAPLRGSTTGSGGSVLKALSTSMVRDPLIGTSVSGYLVKGRLGAGGMGIVYEGEQPVIGKRVAIKVLRPEIAENPEQVQRLVSEARAVNAVGHRGIIDVFGYGELEDGRQCIVMEYLDGEPLADLLVRNRNEHRATPVIEVMLILEEILSALAAAHGAGVIHRDLKPSNIFLCKQRDGSRFVKVLDFGIAKLGVLGATPQSQASMLVGTPSYMAPEQARGGMVSPALDLYAVGIITFEMVTGQLPFNGDSVVEVLMKHAEAPAPKPSSLLMSIPDELDDIVLKLLEKKPQDRFQTADEVRAQVVRVRKALTDSTAGRSGLDLLRPSAAAAAPLPKRQPTPAPRQPTPAPVAVKPESAPLNDPEVGVATLFQARPLSLPTAQEQAAAPKDDGPTVLSAQRPAGLEDQSGQAEDGDTTLPPPTRKRPGLKATAPARPAPREEEPEDPRSTMEVDREALKDLEAIQRGGGSKRTGMIVGGLVLAGLAVGGVVFFGGKAEAPLKPEPAKTVEPAEPVAVKPPEPEVKPVEPVAVKPPEPEVKPVEPVAVKPPEPEVKPTEPAVAKPTEPAAVKPTRPGQVKPSEPTTPRGAPKSAALARLQKLEARLKKAGREDGDVDLRVVKKLIKALSDPSLPNRATVEEQAESRAASIEAGL